MLLIFMLCVLLASLVIYRLWTRDRSERDPPCADRGDYCSVEIEPGDSACGAAETCSGRRFLCREAPLLPLPDCDCACQCRYIRYRDRRVDDRRLPFGNYAVADVDPVRADRRDESDRRASA